MFCIVILHTLGFFPPMMPKPSNIPPLKNVEFSPKGGYVGRNTPDIFRYPCYEEAAVRNNVCLLFFITFRCKTVWASDYLGYPK